MIVFIDIDSVLNNLSEVWFSRYNKAYNDNLSLQMIKTWDVHLYAKAGYRIYDFLEDASLYEECTPAPISQEVISFLRKDVNITLYFVTTTVGPKSILGKYNWMQQHYNITPKEYITLHNKALLFSPDTITVLLDDGVHNLEDFRGVRLLYNQPYNEDEKRFPIVYDWREALRAIDFINQIDYRQFYFSRDSIERGLIAEGFIGK